MFELSTSVLPRNNQNKFIGTERLGQKGDNGGAYFQVSPKFNMAEVQWQIYLKCYNLFKKIIIICR